MENLMLRNQTRMRSSTPLSVHKNSQTISKPKPKIRIIHIFAPEIIKTDVANFRELVQKLTGKPSREKGDKNRARNNRSHQQPDQQSNFFMEKPVAKKMELRSGFISGLETTREILIKEEEGLWINNHGDSNFISGGNFLSGFGDLDGFIQELGEFPLLPLDATSSHHHMHGFEEVQLA